MPVLDKKSNRIVDLVLLSLMLILFVDIVFMGTGAWTNLINFSVRKYLFSIISAYSLAYWLNNNNDIIDDVRAVNFLFIFLLLWELVALLKGVPLKNAISDSLALYGLIFAKAIDFTINRRYNYELLKKVLLLLTIALAIIHLVLCIWGNLSADGAIQAKILATFILDPVRGMDSSDLMIHTTPEGFFRVYWTSSAFLLIGLYLSIQRVGRSMRIINYLLVCLFISAIICTWSRGVIIGSFFIVLAAIASIGISTRQRINVVFFAAFGALLMAMTIPLVIMSKPELIQLFGISRVGSDEWRNGQVDFLISELVNNFLWGTGFGGHAKGWTSSSQFPWSYEMSVLAYYMKVGVIGTLFSLFIFIEFMRSTHIKKINRLTRLDFATLCGLLIAIVFASNTNPYLFSLSGTIFILFIYLEFCSIGRLTNL